MPALPPVALSNNKTDARFAVAINRHGQVAGTIENEHGVRRAVLYRKQMARGFARDGHPHQHVIERVRRGRHSRHARRDIGIDQRRRRLDAQRFGQCHHQQRLVLAVAEPVLIDQCGRGRRMRAGAHFDIEVPDFARHQLQDRRPIGKFRPLHPAIAIVPTARVIFL